MSLDLQRPSVPSAPRRRAPRRRRRDQAAGGAAGTAGVSGFLVQHLPGGPTFHDPTAAFGHGLSVALILLGAVIACLTVVAAKLLTVLVGRGRRRWRARAGRRRGERAAANVEKRARALMSELCPQGWRAQITLFGPGDELPPDAPQGERAHVALDWAELEDERRRIAVVRRVWAPTISDALEAMVADRRTDETLEQIERGAVADGAHWSDL